MKDRYLIKLSLFALFLGLLVYFFNLKYQFKFNSFHAWYIVLYMYGLVLLMHLALQKTFAQRPQAFVYRFMGFSGLRLVLHFMILIVYCLIFRNLLVGFTVQFLIIYFLFTIFEIYFLYRALRQIPKVN